MRQIILASQSPQRRAMLATLGVKFKTVAANVDEQAIQDTDLKRRAGKVALTKARAVQQRYPKAIIIAGDTYIVDGNTALEKPRDLDEARAMLRRQSGRQVWEYTGVCYLDSQQHIEFIETAVAKTWFRELSEQEIERYVTTEPVTTWSAAFCPAYDTGAALIERIDGSFTSFTHGLPLELIVPLLRRSGVMV